MFPNQQLSQTAKHSTSASTALPLLRQLRWQILIVFVLLAILPILVVEIITLPRVMEQAETQVFQQLDSVAQLKGDQIQSWISNSHIALDLLLVGPMSEEVKAFLKTPQPTPQQQERINGMLQSAVATIHERQGSTHLHHDTLFTGYFIYTPEGRIVATSDPLQQGQSIVATQYFTSSLEADMMHAPFYAAGSENFSIFVTHRIFDDQGTLLGIMVAQSNTDILSEMMLQRTGMGESGETYLVSKENNYLLTPSRFQGYPMTRAYRSQGIDEGLSGSNGHAVYQNYEREPALVLGSYRWIPELHVALVAEVKDQEALKSIDLVERVSITVAIVVALLVGLLSLFLAGRIGTPISRLTQAAIQIAQGDLDKRVSVKSTNEIGVLASSFNSMAGRVKQLVEELEQRVAARTNDLQTALQQREQTVTELQESLAIRDQLNMTIRELSSPVLPLIDGVIVIPLIGVIDSQRAQMLMSEVLSHIKRSHAHIVIIDVTGVPIIDTQVAQALVHTATAAVLLGARPILVGIRPEIAQTLVSLGVDLKVFEPQADLRSAILLALGRYSKGR